MEKSIAYSPYLWKLDAATEFEEAWRTFRLIAETVQGKVIIQDMSTAQQLGSSFNRPVNFKLRPSFVNPCIKEGVL